MADWTSYRPEDFLLFSERAYWPLFEDLNAALWPSQVLALALGGWCLWRAWRRPSEARPRRNLDGPVALVLALAWAVSAWAFVWARYADINWAVLHLLPLFAGQAGLLLIWGLLLPRVVFRLEARPASLAGLALAVYALGVHPLLAVIDGRGLAGAEVFALAPLPTALATLGFLAMAAGGWRVWLLRLVPLFWCAVEWATLETLGTWQAWAPALGGLIGLAAGLRRRPRGGATT